MALGRVFLAIEKSCTYSSARSLNLDLNLYFLAMFKCSLKRTSPDFHLICSQLKPSLLDFGTSTSHLRLYFGQQNHFVAT